jgi:hypothetical protein
MSKANLTGSASWGTVRHSSINSRLHQLHQVEQRARRRTRYIAHKEVVDGTEPEKFQSNLLGLAPPGSKGRTFRRTGDCLAEMDERAWEQALMDEAKRLSVWHERRERDGKVTYHRHKLKESDVKRKTVELRPDHSRALEVLAASQPKSLVKEALEAIRAEKVRLFELIYGRKVIQAAEHCDSGHYHTDLWNVGAVAKVEGGREIIERGTLFREFGVGPGAARWDRHLGVLQELGHDPAVMGAVPAVLEADAAKALDQNREPARDIRFMRALDSFVERTLRQIDPAAVDQAKKEYGEHLLDGYAKGELGLKKVDPKQEKIKKLEAENKRLTDALVRVGEFFAAIVRVRGFQKLIGLHPAVAKLFQAALAACGLELTKTKRQKNPKLERMKEKTKELEMLMEKQMEGPSRPSF